MRDATVEQWQNLFDYAQKIKTLRPWDYFGDMELIAVKPKGFKDKIYCSVLGMDGGVVGLVLYMGESGLKDFFRTAYCEKLYIPPKYAYYEQSHIACYLTPREGLEGNDLSFLQMIDRENLSDERVPLFSSQKKGYAEDALDELAVILMTEVFKNLLPIFEDPEIKESCDYSAGEYLSGEYDELKQSYIFRNLNHENELMLFDHYEWTDFKMIERLKAFPANENTLILDVDHTPFVTEHPEGGRPIQPKLFLVLMADTHQVVKHEFLSPETDLMSYTLDTLISYIEEKGKMKKVIVRNAILLHYLKTTLDALDVAIDYEPLDDFFDEYYGDFYTQFS